MKGYTLDGVKQRIGSNAKLFEYTSEANAKDHFIRICDDLGYQWRNCIESYDTYTIIAEAGGIGHDYSITLSYEKIHNA